MHHSFYAFFHTNFAKSQGAGGNMPPGLHCAYQRYGIYLSFLLVHGSDDFFIAGKLDVPAQQDVRGPH